MEHFRAFIRFQEHCIQVSGNPIRTTAVVAMQRNRLDDKSEADFNELRILCDLFLDKHEEIMKGVYEYLRRAYNIPLAEYRRFILREVKKQKQAAAGSTSSAGSSASSADSGVSDVDHDTSSEAAPSSKLGQADIGMLAASMGLFPSFQGYVLKRGG
ncbi:uncharacterized protein K452DRAFT_303508 [Aplosporella prunicola CBS 121167]|uniref:Uncharacterized protein n=1 Tax=Aplosporella prunicola CBS 121167 TaxID=1176127 RepID=A0A6A6AU62_9PEZI|nr:uncharacterized protein K452DRAFT_303508 [Aplosporella prunicola CBS 121167]KAF2135489.1 hypothetical protein K452DRAFT_303508 [Aplosporella prunicola CBS 121167]